MNKKTNYQHYQNEIMRYMSDDTYTDKQFSEDTGTSSQWNYKEFVEWCNKEYDNSEFDILKEEEIKSVYDKAAEQELIIKKLNIALETFIEWAVECGFDYESLSIIYDEYENEVANKGLCEGMKYIAIKEAEREMDFHL